MKYINKNAAAIEKKTINGFSCIPQLAHTSSVLHTEVLLNAASHILRYNNTFWRCWNNEYINTSTDTKNNRYTSINCATRSETIILHIPKGEIIRGQCTDIFSHSSSSRLRKEMASMQNPIPPRILGGNAIARIAMGMRQRTQPERNTILRCAGISAASSILYFKLHK